MQLKPNDLTTEFAGGDQLSVPCAVPMMSALPNDWFRFFFCYSYGSQLFGLEHNKDEVLAGKFRN